MSYNLSCNTPFKDYFFEQPTYSYDSISWSYSIKRTVPKNPKNLYLTYSTISKYFFITSKIEWFDFFSQNLY